MPRALQGLITYLKYGVKESLLSLPVPAVLGPIPFPLWPFAFFLLLNAYSLHFPPINCARGQVLREENSESPCPHHPKYSIKVLGGDHHGRLVHSQQKRQRGCQHNRSSNKSKWFTQSRSRATFRGHHHPLIGHTSVIRFRKMTPDDISQLYQQAMLRV